MKKNKMMRLASGLLVAVLITTSTISGTFAKYVTAADAKDSARVAKFGAVVTASGYLFDTTYVEEAEDNVPGTQKPGAAITVKSSDTDKLVAPGTKNDTGMSFAIKGKPEVDVKVAVATTFEDDTEITAANKHLLDVYLAAKTGLPDMTTGKADDTFNNDALYQPVKFTLTQTTTGGTTTLVDGKTLADVVTALKAFEDVTVKANNELADVIGTFKLTWEWKFEDSVGTPGNYDATDKKDILLGDLAAGTILTPGVGLEAGTATEVKDYNLNTGIKIVVSVTQID